MIIFCWERVGRDISFVSSVIYFYKEGSTCEE